MQKFKIVRDILCNMEVLKVVNLNNIAVDVVFIKDVNAVEAYNQLAEKYNVN